MRYLKLLLTIGSVVCFVEEINATENWLPPKSKELCKIRIDASGGGSSVTYYASKLDVPTVVDLLEKKFGTKAKQDSNSFRVPSG